MPFMLWIRTNRISNPGIEWLSSRRSARCETAINLANSAKSITCSNLALRIFTTGIRSRSPDRKWKRRHQVLYQPGAQGIKKDAVEVEGAVYPADTIVYCVGMNPRVEAVEAIKSAAVISR